MERKHPPDLNETEMTEQIEIQTTRQRSTIKLRFDRGEDRWRHCLVLASGDSEFGIMSSVEGTPEQNFPPSAPLQDASRHRLEQGEAVLCVGMAGQSHWSAAFSVEHEGPAESIKSDLACLQKTTTPGAHLGSTYQLNLPCRVQSFNERCLEIRLENQNTFVVEALSGNDFQTVFELNDRTFRVMPSQVSTSPVIATRWGFMVTNKCETSPDDISDLEQR